MSLVETFFAIAHDHCSCHGIILLIYFYHSKTKWLGFFFFSECACLFLLLIESVLWYYYFFKTGTYIDKKCPFTGNVSIRGRILAGTCHSAKMNRTIIVRRNYLHFIKKYQRYYSLFIPWCPVFICTRRNIINNSVVFLCPLFRYEKRHSNIPAHVSPCFRVKEGDHVIIGQCRWDSKGGSFFFVLNYDLVCVCVSGLLI